MSDKKKINPSEQDVREGIARAVETFKTHRGMTQQEAEKHATDLARKRAKKEGVR